jgi:hypothetical protein
MRPAASGLLGLFLLIQACGCEKPKQPPKLALPKSTEDERGAAEARQPLIAQVKRAASLRTGTKQPIVEVRDASGKVMLKIDRTKIDPQRPVPPFTVERFPTEADAFVEINPSGDDPSLLHLTFKQPMTTRFVLVDQDGKEESRAVEARVQFFVAVGKSRPWSPTSKKSIAQARLPNDQIIRVEFVGDERKSVRVTGLAVGDVRLTLKSVDGQEESFDVVVRSLTDSGSNTLILTMGEKPTVVSTKQSIVNVFTDSTCVRVEPVVNDQTKLMLEPVSPGVGSLTLIDQEKKKTVIEVIVVEPEK